MAVRSRTKGSSPGGGSLFVFSALRQGAEGPLELHTLVEKGVPSRVLAKIREQTGLTVKELAEILGVAPRTVGRREQELGLLKKPEGDRAVRFARVMHAANEAIGDVSQAVRWLRKPNTALGGSTPLQLITSEPGTELVLAALDRIAYGGVV